MFVLKSCPHCGGDLAGNLDGAFSCIQCGYEPKPQEQTDMLARIRQERMRRARPLVAAGR